MSYTHTEHHLWALVRRLENDRALLRELTPATDKGTHTELLRHLGAAEVAARRLLIEQVGVSGEERGGFV
ncbi:MAG TPA: hypothetical protein VM915_16785 [Verrucomicrobiae bacterium]|jgi:hypothetical protein|nr:hypothetical protein [Verrucomicrobiae bacterium]